MRPRSSTAKVSALTVSIAVFAFAVATLFGAGGATAATSRAAYTTGQVSSTSPVPPGYTDDQSAANRARAKADAKHLLKLVKLPAGSVRLKRSPAGDHGYLRAAVGVNRAAASVSDARWWTVSGSPSALISALEATPPDGATQDGTSGASNSRTGTTSSGVLFVLPAIKNKLTSREINVTATTLSDGKTGVLVQSQSDWQVLRSISERIPASVTTVKINTSAASKAGKHTKGTAITTDVTTTSQVGSIIKIVNAMPVVRPGFYGCPMRLFDRERNVTMKFLSAAGKPLATLKDSDFRPLLGASGACNSVSLKVNGKRGRQLSGGTFIRKIQKLLGKPIV